MTGIGSLGDSVLPIESLRPLFRSRTLATAFAEKLIRSGRLAKVGIEGRLVCRPAPWSRDSQREDRGDVTARLRRIVTGHELFEILLDCGLSARNADQTALVLTVWNNYILWFNTAAAARVPHFVRFEFKRPTGGKRVAAPGVPRSGLHAVYDGDTIYSLRLTAAGVALGEVSGVRPRLTERS